MPSCAVFAASQNQDAETMNHGRGISRMHRSQPVTSVAVILFVLYLGFSLAWGQDDVLTRHHESPQSGLQADETLPMPANVTTTPIEHVVFLVKENHSFDSLFGTFPGAAGATTGVTSKGQTIALSHASDTPPNFAHSW